MDVKEEKKPIVAKEEEVIGEEIVSNLYMLYSDSNHY